MRRPIVGKTLSLTNLSLASYDDGGTAWTGSDRVAEFVRWSGPGPYRHQRHLERDGSFGNSDRQDQVQLVMVLYQNGSEITGSIGPSADRQILTISNGRIEGNNVSLDIGNEQAKISVQFQLEAGKAEGRFRTSNQQGVMIQGAGNGQVQVDRMTFQWSATRGDQRLYRRDLARFFFRVH